MSDFNSPISTVSITAGGTAQTLLVAADADTPRQTVMINPQTEACVINWGVNSDGNPQTAGLRASGTLEAGSNPIDAVTIAVNGVTFTFKTVVVTPATDVLIGATEADTMTNFAAVLNASVNASISVATYTVSGAIVTITYDAGGTTGNAYTLANSSGAGAVTRSAATLTGGLNTAGGMVLTQNQVVVLSASDFPQIRGAIQVVSATTAAKISVGYGQA